MDSRLYVAFMAVVILLIGIFVIFDESSNKYYEKCDKKVSCIKENSKLIEKFTLDCIENGSKKTGAFSTNSFIDKCGREAIGIFCGY